MVFFFHDGVSDFPHGAGPSLPGLYFYRDHGRMEPNGPYVPRLAFFVRSVHDAHDDVLAGPISWVGAVAWVVRNWGWLRRQDAAGWTVPPVA